MSTENHGIVSYFIGISNDGLVFMEKEVVNDKAEFATQNAACYREDAEWLDTSGLSEARKNLEALFAAIKEGEKFLHRHPF